MEQSKKNITFVLLKSILVAVCISLVGILVFALILKFVDLSEGFVKIINQIIKILSIFGGTYLCLKTEKSKGYLKGLLVGLGYTVIAFLVFSLLDGNLNLNLTFLTDIVFGGIIGAICGVFCANFKSKHSI